MLFFIKTRKNYLDADPAGSAQTLQNSFFINSFHNDQNPHFALDQRRYFRRERWGHTVSKTGPAQHRKINYVAMDSISFCHFSLWGMLWAVFTGEMHYYSKWVSKGDIKQRLTRNDGFWGKRKVKEVKRESGKDAAQHRKPNRRESQERFASNLRSSPFHFISFFIYFYF